MGKGIVGRLRGLFASDAHGSMAVSARPIEALECRRLLSAAAGSLDTGFGSHGIVQTSNRTFGGPQHAVAEQADGKLVVASLAPDGISWLIARYNTNGSLDGSFAVGGHFVQSIGGQDPDEGGELTQPNAVAIAPDGSIYVGGQANYGDNNGDAVLLKLNANGKQVFLQHDDYGGITGGLDGITSLAIAADGDVMAGGFAGETTKPASDFAVWRFGPSGTLDSSFGTGGLVRAAVGGYLDQIQNVAIQPDGKIVAAGTVQQTATNYHGGGYSVETIEVLRLTANGTVDTSFGTVGRVSFSFPNAVQSAANDMALGPGGAIVLAGYAGYVAAGDQGPDSATAVVRLTSAGTLDTTFNHTGYLITPPGANAPDTPTADDGFANAVVVQSDGDILTTGVAFSSQSIFVTAVTRLLPSGALDPAFGSNGVAEIDASGGFGSDLSRESLGQGLLLQPDGKAVVIGEAEHAAPGASTTNRFLLRLTGDTGSISGTIYNDLNGNGTRQANESGVAGFEIYIDKSNSLKLEPGDPTTFTDADGNYSFLGVSPGSNIIVRVILPTGWKQITPTRGYGQHVNVSAGSVTTGATFGISYDAVINPFGSALAGAFEPLSPIDLLLG